jgi:hypothetical protein
MDQLSDQTSRANQYAPIVVRRGLFSLDALLQHVSPSPDPETERFIEIIYSLRRESPDGSPAE